jgi:hypothetical protein
VKTVLIGAAPHPADGCGGGGAHVVGDGVGGLLSGQRTGVLVVLRDVDRPRCCPVRHAVLIAVRGDLLRRQRTLLLLLAQCAARQVRQCGCRGADSAGDAGQPVVLRELRPAGRQERVHQALHADTGGLPAELDGAVRQLHQRLRCRRRRRPARAAAEHAASAARRLQAALNQRVDGAARHDAKARAAWVDALGRCEPADPRRVRSDAASR